ncbi:hypothetical protein CDAR_521071 [Caerostris darwini]|uniref:Uncharacterized protein n=1 Tax=Caerostris darwini TaxID=1538125 RepID=A0AAV4V9Q1_9ARAC|nr:hypothetical protein CDAR_521071 [Caerostris darwini]
MWASRPSHYDNDMPIDLRKKVVLLRDQEESQKKELVHKPEERPHSLERWHQQPTPLLVNHLQPFASERYGVRCLPVSQDENRGYEPKYGSRGALEAAIRKLHHNRQLQKTTEPPKEERCRSTDILDKPQKDESLEGKRSNSCPNLTVIKPKPSPMKPKSSFIQRSSEYLRNESNGNSTSSIYHPESDDLSNPHLVNGAKKRKSFIPVYGDRAPSPKRKPMSPTEHSSYDEYFSHPEILLRRQLQQHSPSPYLFHVYDYYQQLVQRLREHSPGVQLPAPMSPNSMDDEMPSDPQRRRPCRALTGKHVRHGTGASLSTLLTLRQKIEERQKAKEHHPLNVLNGSCNKNLSPKKIKTQKAKPNSKNLLSKI